MASRASLVLVAPAFVGAAAAIATIAGFGRQPAAGPSVRTSLDGLQVFPADNPWNTDISKYPVHRDSAAFIASIGPDRSLHPDFGTDWGIPFALARVGQTRVPIEFTDWPEESDPGPYPVPRDAPIEGGAASGGDRHVLVVDVHRKMLYEMYRAFPIDGGTSWEAACGAVFDLTSNELRPEGWTSADAAGLPIFAGLARWDEAVEKGEIRHALRFTVSRTQRGYIHPATHWASSSTDPALPPMGLRVRLKASVDETKFPAGVRPIIRCLKTYGMIVADNGGDWFVTGAPDPRWNDEEVDTLKGIKGRDFEVVDTGPIIRE